MTMVYFNVTDGQTDGRTERNTSATILRSALVHASRGKKYNESTVNLVSNDKKYTQRRQIHTMDSRLNKISSDPKLTILILDHAPPRRPIGEAYNAPQSP